ncbi:hypothetical protein CDAR_280401 [Caerostris darwini]|uniref:Uncharacterized protein n=1 Tax=Caerostris darwini TaxID=1538125 RepID=A0AAV4VH74_9ARAC|nr:hypothetical protein CDAR_280401 [Caerostris darwini]
MKILIVVKVGYCSMAFIWDEAGFRMQMPCTLPGVKSIFEQGPSPLPPLTPFWAYNFIFSFSRRLLAPSRQGEQTNTFPLFSSKRFYDLENAPGRDWKIPETFLRREFGKYNGPLHFRET